ncbi:MAG TPA: DNA-directed RNA polymerase subunit A' [Euryarchaeota archaeon]|nr:MAG: DNA-directed RNA polymerase subunit A' [Thermoplasmatales archaeon ex4484_6]HHD16841.1 DNA-directed RNA polymerase subunit A' [Euryarchaeota archaeon]
MVSYQYIPKKIGKIQFALLSPDEIRKMSATKIITADTYDDDGFPIDMGLMDPRLGVIEPGLKCKTCGKKVDECPGHFGHIDLAMPVIHEGYTKMIKEILSATCRVCGRVKLPTERMNYYNEKIAEIGDISSTPFQYISLASTIRSEAIGISQCPHPDCGEMSKNISLDKPTTYREEGHKLTPKEIRERLEKIPSDQLLLLGLNPEVSRPEWMILTSLPVPPVTVRPSITLESGDRSEDDLTHKLVDVLRINQRLQENRDSGAPQLIVEDLWELLQYHVTTYFDNQTSGIPPARHRSGRPLKTLAQRLKGKEGRFRSNLSGKRVNFSARTVISPDPYISINEVGVPLAIAMELTVPMRVNEFNFDIARKFVERGSEVHPGANYIIRPDGQRLRLTERNKETLLEKLQVGYIVERHLMDGDIVLFNRQPSLHRMSMMAHEVRVMDGKTFRLNLPDCPPYNADFDGDEMNLHCLQGEEARAEAKIIMRVQEHILSPRFGGPVIGAIHDHISGTFMLTHHNPLFTKEEAYHILSRTSFRGSLPEPDHVDENGNEFWGGKTIFSQILPPDLHMEYHSAVYTGDENAEEEDSIVRIEPDEEGRSLLKSGPIDERSIGAFKGKLLEKIVRDYGSDAGRQFLDDATRVGITAITLMGFSTGIDEEDIPDEAKLRIQETLNEAEAKVDDYVNKFNSGYLEPLPGRSLKETLEVEAMRTLGRARDQAGQIASRYLGLKNSAVIMARSGARGSMLNLSQMSGSIGQQAVRGERIQRGYQGRTLPHFKRMDLGAAAKGFVKSCYKSGLNPTEYFFHSMGGREGLVDTAVRTSRSGYMQRRLINALEDLKVLPDRTVRNTSGIIIQFRYGEDGIDPSRSARSDPIDYDDIIRTAIREVS